MRKGLIIGIMALLSLGLTARGQETADTAPIKETKAKKKRAASEIFTGFSGGMMLHAGYQFSDSPDKIFSNTGLGNPDYVKALPKDGACFGLGGALRCHLINHIHLGAEGGVSTMPLMRTGSNIRTAWGGALCDFYANWGKVRPIIGMTVGGGAMRRLYVPDAPVVTSADETNYNASYSKTPFFFMDPYVGMEFGLNGHMALILRIDYMLPFGTTNSNLAGKVNWGNFMTPSGPRLYFGIMFGKMNTN